MKNRKTEILYFDAAREIRRQDGRRPRKKITAAEQIHDWGVREVIITLGGGGSVIYAEGKFYETPAYPPRHLVDATGCGDTYSAGYLYARARNISYAESGRFAAAMCTLKLEHTGPFDHSIEDVYRIIRK